jgi:hypothetical protein
MPYSQDVLTNIFNVQWGAGDVIVVFMEISPFDPQLDFDLKLPGSDAKATFLSSWTTPTYSTDPAPLKNSAYSVSANVGEFLESIAPAPPEGLDFNGAQLGVFVFAALDTDPAGGLARATAGTKLIAPLFIVNALNADLTSEIAPPGLRWGIETGVMATEVTMTWKMRFGEHRAAEPPPPPPNGMVQCYPLVSSHAGYLGDIAVTYSGYYLLAYRLDVDGTGDVYSEFANPSEWNVPVTDSSDPDGGNGIPFGDPPPLISADVN